MTSRISFTMTDGSSVSMSSSTSECPNPECACLIGELKDLGMNEWSITKLCSCGGGHYVYSKDETPGFKFSHKGKCCACGE